MSVNLYNATTDTLKNVAGDIINPKSVNEMIAPIENGTASKDYAVGEQFIMNDLLCEVTQAIAQGDTMVIGTNCEESEQLSKQIKDIKSDLNTKVSITTGSNETYATALAKLKAVVNWNKVTEKSTLHTYKVGLPLAGDVYQCYDRRGLFTKISSGASAVECYTANMVYNNTSLNKWTIDTSGATYTSFDNKTIEANIIFEIWY